MRWRWRSLLQLAAVAVGLVYALGPQQPVTEVWAARLATGCWTEGNVTCVAEGCFLYPRVVDKSVGTLYGFASLPSQVVVEHTGRFWVRLRTRVYHPSSVVCLLRSQ